MKKINKTNRVISLCEAILFGYKKTIIAIILLITLVMLYFSTQLRVDAGFMKQLPLKHDYMKTFVEYKEDFGGANRILVAVMDESGDMFNANFFQVLEQVTNEVFFIPGVNRASVKSIFTPNVRFVEVVEDGFSGGNVIPTDFSPSADMFETVKSNIIKSGVVGRLVAENFNGAIVWADLLENDPVSGKKIDYQKVSNGLEDIRRKYEKDTLKLNIIGFAKIVGDISEGAKSVIYFFILAILITIVLLFWYTRHWLLSLYPIVCAIIAVVWQLGTLKLLGMGVDPMNILTPFLIFAIGVSHGVQMVSVWRDELIHQKKNQWNSHSAARKAFAALLIPGMIALLSDTIGFATIYLIDIRIIQELAITATIGVALIIITNLLLLPILLSTIRLKNTARYVKGNEQRTERLGKVWQNIGAFAKKPAALIGVFVSTLLFVFGYINASKVQIGDSQSGVPELRPESRYNQDAMRISTEFSLGVDMINVIAKTTPNACTESYDTMKNIDRFAWYMENVPGVQQVVTLSQFAKVITAGWNEGNPKWRELSRNNYVMRQSLSNIETDTGLLNGDCSVMPVMIFADDHKASTINRIVQAVETYKTRFPAEYNKSGELREGAVEFKMATGNMGVMAATNDVVSQAQLPMLIFVYVAVIFLCLVTFRSVSGTLSIVVPLALVSFLAYTLMAYLGIGLKVNTLPVVALGVGIGVDYGIYIYSRLQQQMNKHASLYDAYIKTLQLTGKAVLFTAITLAVGVGSWIFSTLKFQADMGILLAFMFILNMVGALLLLPALVYILKPRKNQ